jgi:ADP-heptose:LPS heptosyltransferase
MIIHYDCRYFLGYKPCRFHRECNDCPHFSPWGKRILIIKLAAMGDVLRTTPLLRGLKESNDVCHITWLTEPNVVPILSGISGIDRLLPYTQDAVLQMEMETFDELYCFDKEPRATALAMKIKAAHKVGFGMSPMGNTISLNKESEYTYELGINDRLKFRINSKTYPELVFESAGIPYDSPQEYILPDLSPEIRQAEKWLLKSGVHPDDVKIGLNTGAGDVFATKKWTEEGYIRLANRLTKELGAKVLLLGGPGEVVRNRKIAEATQYPVINTGNSNSIREFAGLVGNCNLMVTGDTLAMHIAIGLKVPVLVMLGPTCHQEIELYGRGAKVISDFDCSPCYLSVCAKKVTCMKALSVDSVFKSVAGLLQIQRRPAAKRKIPKNKTGVNRKTRISG